MLKKTFCFCFAAGFFAVCAAAEPVTPTPDAGQKSEYVFVKAYRSNMDPEKYEDPVKAAELFTERQKLLKSLQDVKRRTMQENAQARKIRQEMRRLLDELTLIIESKEEVKRLNRKLDKVDKELDALPMKNAKTAGDKAAAKPAAEPAAQPEVKPAEPAKK